MASFHEAVRSDHEHAEAFYPSLARAYAAELRRLGRGAARAFSHYQWRRPILAAAGWQLPDPDEVLSTIQAASLIDRRTEGLRVRVAEAAVAGQLARLGLSFDVSNPLLAGVLTGMGRHITHIVETTRADIMRIVQEGYDEGWSITRTAREISHATSEASEHRGEVIARTELTRATNAGSLTGARLTAEASPGIGMLKAWLNASDDRVRDSHAEAGDAYDEANAIPLDQAFVVGGWPMQYPGDDSAPPEETISCRCDLLWVERGQTASGRPYKRPIRRRVYRHS